jgi:hypothetical protein
MYSILAELIQAGNKALFSDFDKRNLSLIKKVLLQQ